MLKLEIKQPLKTLACIDLQVEIVPVPFAKLSEQKDGESSAVIRARVVAARAIQTRRFAGEDGV